MIIRKFIMSTGCFSTLHCILLILAFTVEFQGVLASDSPPQGVTYDDCGRNEHHHHPNHVAVSVNSGSSLPSIDVDCTAVYSLGTDRPQKFNLGKGGGTITIRKLHIPKDEFVYMKNLKCPTGNCTIVKLDNTAKAPLTFKSSNRFVVGTKSRKTNVIFKFTCTRNSDKRGKCPTPGGVGKCVESCTTDKSCPGTLKCCSNGCGHVCTAPEQVKLKEECTSEEQCIVNADCANVGGVNRCKCKDKFAPSKSLPAQCIPTVCRSVVSVLLTEVWNPHYLDSSSADYVVLKEKLIADLSSGDSSNVENINFSESDGRVKATYTITTEYIEGETEEKDKRTTWTSPGKQKTKQIVKKREAIYKIKDLVRATLRNSGLKYDSIEAHLYGELNHLCYNQKDCRMENSRCISRTCTCLRGANEGMTECLV